MPNLSLDEAERVLSAGIVRATELSVPVNIAVLDAGVNLKAFVRMDGALLGSIDIAMGKARTSALFQANSEESRRPLSLPVSAEPPGHSHRRHRAIGLSCVVTGSSHVSLLVRTYRPIT